MHCASSARACQMRWSAYRMYTSRTMWSIILTDRSSNAMPREVRAAIAWCISTSGAGSMTEVEAEAYVEAMFDDGRGGEESW